MPGINAESLVDLAKTTIKELGEPDYTNLMTDLQDFPAYMQLIDKSKQIIGSGNGIQWDVATKAGTNAQNSAPYQEDNLNITDGMTQASVNWRGSTGGYALAKQEISMNTGKRQIVDLFKFKRAQAMMEYAELMEANFWAFPLATDIKTPLGLPYWITKSATEGFTGGLPSGYTTVANIVPSGDYVRWQNWAGPYATVSKDDLVRKMRKASRYTNFKSPVQTPSTNTGYKYTYATNYAVVGAMEEMLEAQNDSLGNDIASKDGMVTFRRNPMMDIPFLDADTTNPVYGIIWGTLKCHVLKDWWMNESVLDKTPGQHTVISVFFDSMYQFVMKNRRDGFVLSTGTSYPNV